VFGPCTSPVTYSRLALGGHVFRVRAGASGVAGTAASYRWRVVASPRRLVRASGSTTVPRPILTATPVRPYDSGEATFAWRATGGLPWPRGTTFECALDRRAWLRCRSPRVYRGLHSGRHSFRVRADLNGRRSRTARFSWTITLLVPAAPILEADALDGNSGTATFVFSGEGAATYECRLDGGDWTHCTRPLTLRGLSTGAHELCVRGLSSEGVLGPATCFTWTVSPATSSSSGGSAPPPSPAPSRFSISGDVSTPLVPGLQADLPLHISNRNGFDIEVSNLMVLVEPGSSRAGCDGPSNLDVVQSNASSNTVWVRVPAHASVTLPAGGATAPEVAMRDLASNQDACKGAGFRLSYSATAREAP
jgi:hypothetical protein